VTESNTPVKKKKKPSPLIDLLVSIVIPNFILIKFSGADYLGPKLGLVVALSFPIAWGLYELYTNGTRNYVAILGVVGVLLTGGISLLELDNKWIAVKEAAIPLSLGIGVLVAHFFGFPMIRKLLFNPVVMQVDRVEAALHERNNYEKFTSGLDRANLFFAGTFFFSAVANYILAKTIVVSESGTEEFTRELGVLGAWSYPVIAGPSVVMMMAIFYYIWRTISKLTNLTLEEIVVVEEDDDDKSKESDKT